MELEKSEFYEMTEKDRIDSLQANCDEVFEDFRYSRKITQDEKESLQDEISSLIQKNEEISDMTKDLNAQKSDNNKTILTNNRIVVSGFISQKEKVYKIVNTVTGFFEYINESGIIVAKDRIKGIHSGNIFRNAINQ